jgi:hypothetical protein
MGKLEKIIWSLNRGFSEYFRVVRNKLEFNKWRNREFKEIIEYIK